MQLDEIVQSIEQAFGDDLPLASDAVTTQKLVALQDLLGDNTYQHYLQDQTNRQIIRDYLVNALMLGVIAEEQLDTLTAQLATEEGRAAASLHILMSSVEEANALCQNSEIDKLNQLAATPKSPPNMKLVPN